MLTRTAMHDDWNGYKNVRNFNACLDERDCMSFGTFTKLFRYVSKGMHKQQIYCKHNQIYFQLGTSSMNSKVTGEGDGAAEVKKKPLQFSDINSDF